MCKMFGAMVLMVWCRIEWYLPGNYLTDIMHTWGKTGDDMISPQKCKAFMFWSKTSKDQLSVHLKHIVGL